MTPSTWRKVRLKQNQDLSWSVLMFYTWLAVPQGAKDILRLNLKTEDLTEEEALATGKRLEDAFVKLDESCRTMEERRKKP